MHSPKVLALMPWGRLFWAVGGGGRSHKSRVLCPAVSWGNGYISIRACPLPGPWPAATEAIIVVIAGAPGGGETAD